jgi:hypothetical protein
MPFLLTNFTISFSTQFIGAATRQEQPVGHDLRSRTTDVVPVRCRHPVTDVPVVFLDTPGFDDTESKDIGVLDKISKWLTAM